MKAPPYIAGFDSASGMLRATARFLRGKGFPRVGLTSPKLLPLVPFTILIDKLPLVLRKQVYIKAGASEAMPASHTKDVHAEDISRWTASLYPERRYPAIAIGSSNGAAVHLYAALGIPWLPQTFLIPVKHQIPIDKPKVDLEELRGAGEALLDANPDLQLHHMHDPNNDRLMVRSMGYFRVKRIHLGEGYKRFLEERLAPGGTIFLMDCRQSWPTTQVGPRYIFQTGAVGGATPKEYLEGGPAVRTFLACHDSPVRHWDAPATNGIQPEAEWGFADPLGDEVEALARQRGWRVRRVTFDHPMRLSPLVADLYIWWYWQLGIPARRLIVDSFILMDPYWTLRTGAVPFWMIFNDLPGRDALARYLDEAGPFDDIHLMLFSNGVHSIGQTSANEWRDLLRRARHSGQFTGVAPTKYPADFATFARYDREMKQQIPTRYPLPQPLTLDQFDAFLAQTEGRYDVRFEEMQASEQQPLSAAGARA